MATCQHGYDRQICPACARLNSRWASQVVAPITLAQVTIQGDRPAAISWQGYPVRYERYQPDLGGWSEPGVSWIG